MKGLRGVFDLKNKKSLRLGVLLLSALFISSATVLVYDWMIYDKPLNVGGSGSSSPTGSSFSLATISTLALSVFVISLSIYGLLREARKHTSKIPDGQGSSPSSLEPVSLVDEEAGEYLRNDEESSASSSSSG